MERTEADVSPTIMEIVRDYIRQYYTDRLIPIDIAIIPVIWPNTFKFYFNGRSVGMLEDKTWITEDWTWPRIIKSRSIHATDPQFFNIIIEDCERVIESAAEIERRRPI